MADEKSVFRPGDEDVIRQMLGLGEKDEIPIPIQALYKRYGALRDRRDAADAPGYLLALLIACAEATDGTLDLSYAGDDPTETPDGKPAEDDE